MEEEPVINAVNQIKEKFGSLHIAVNCAGTGYPGRILGKESPHPLDAFKFIINLNLVGTFNVMRIAAELMDKNEPDEKGEKGVIINTASIAGIEGQIGQSAYSASKAGVIGLTKSLGKELADKNIAVNAVTPAGAKTRILDQMSKEHVQRMLSKVPRGRFLEIHEFTSLICWLSSEENTFSTAAVFDISGGRSTY